MTKVYVSPTGSGDKSGSDWANAATLTNLDTMIKKAGAGGEVLLAADKGAYKVGSAINLYAAGTDSAPVTIKGVSSATGASMDVTINGTRPADWSNGSERGNELFKLQKGAGHLVFENMNINNVSVAFRAAGDVTDITIQHVDAVNVDRFFEDYAGGSNKTATVSGLVVRDIDVTGFSSGVVRLMYDSHDIVIEDVHGDAAGQNAGYPVGVHLSGTTHDVAIRRTTMENMVDSTSGTYWQGDGFGTEGSVHNVLFEDTVSRGNGDGGYDLKSSGNMLIRAVAEDNKRNFRIWTDATMDDVTGLDPHLRGGIGAQDQLWIAAKAKVKITGGTFSDSGSKTIVFENEGGVVEMIDTHVTMADSARFLVGKSLQGISKADAITTAVTGTFSIATAVSSPGAIKPVVDPVTTVPIATAPVTSTTPVTTTPVTTTPAVATPNKLVAGPNAVLNGTAGADVFFFDQALKLGATKITNFGKDDVLVASKVLTDSNGDGIITFGETLNLESSAGSVAIAGVSSLKLVGHGAEGYVYALQNGTVTAALAGVAPASTPTPVPTPISSPADANGTSWHMVTASASSETLAATAGKDKFVFDLSKKTGADVIVGFGGDDLLVTSVALKDGNGDGLIAFGTNKVLDLGGSKNTVKLPGVTEGLRLVGHTDEGFLYAAADVRPQGAKEGKLGIADTLNGDAGDKLAQTFFFDTALGADSAKDKITAFGAKDILVTTTKIADVAVGASVAAGAVGFSMEGSAGMAIGDTGSHAVSALEFDGVMTADGIHYYVYSLEHSAAGMASLLL